MSQTDKQHELAELRQRVALLESELAAPQTESTEDEAPAWPPHEFYAAYYATTGFLLGAFGAAVSLLVNAIFAPLAGKSSLEIIRVYLTFPMGERALSLSTEGNGWLVLALGCTLYFFTGMLLGVPLYLILVKVCGEKPPLGKRLIVSSIAALGLWIVNFYLILSWVQPLLLHGNWIVDPAVLPPWVAAATHLVFGWTIAVLYPLGQFTPYRRPTA